MPLCLLTGIQQSLEIMTRYRGLQIDPAQTPLFMQEHGERLQKYSGSFSRNYTKDANNRFI
ncbi:MAG: hypothetical protein ACLU30_08020 [Odoribacter splanchnicus]